MTISEEILSILGDNAIHPVVFEENLEVDAIYTYRGEVYCLDSGMDFALSEVTNEGQEYILEAVKNKKYIIDKTFQ